MQSADDIFFTAQCPVLSWATVLALAGALALALALRQALLCVPEPAVGAEFLLVPVLVLAWWQNTHTLGMRATNIHSTFACALGVCPSHFHHGGKNTDDFGREPRAQKRRKNNDRELVKVMLKERGSTVKSDKGASHADWLKDESDKRRRRNKHSPLSTLCHFAVDTF